LADFYDPLESATRENKLEVGEKQRLQNDKTKQWDDTGLILVIRDSGRLYLVERDISVDSVVRNNRPRGGRDCNWSWLGSKPDLHKRRGARSLYC
jgi:hypothetical protein